MLHIQGNDNLAVTVAFEVMKLLERFAFVRAHVNFSIDHRMDTVFAMKWLLTSVRKVIDRKTS